MNLELPQLRSNYLIFYRVLGVISGPIPLLWHSVRYVPFKAIGIYV